MMGFKVIFLWVLAAHIGIRGKGMAVKIAMESTKRSKIDLKVNISTTEIKGIIKQRLKERQQKQWEEERKGTWVHRVRRQVGEIRCARRNRGEEMLISRIRFGHTGPNSSPALFITDKHNTEKNENE